MSIKYVISGLFFLAVGLLLVGRLYGQDTTALLLQLQSSDPELRSDGFYKLLSSPAARNDKVSLAVIGLLGQETAYAEALTSEDEGYATYYSNVVTYVASLQDDRAIPQLTDVIDTGNLVTTTLAGFGPPSLDPVTSKLSDGDPEVRDSATIVLSQMLDPGNYQKINDTVSKQKIAAALTGASRDSDPEVRATANEALVKLASAITLVDITPNYGLLGQTIASVAITGQNTNFVQGTTLANFGAGITVNGLTVLSPTRAKVNITVRNSATVGALTVTLTTGSEMASLVQGFTVTAGTT